MKIPKQSHKIFNRFLPIYIHNYKIKTLNIWTKNHFKGVHLQALFGRMCTILPDCRGRVRFNLSMPLGSSGRLPNSSKAAKTGHFRARQVGKFKEKISKIKSFHTVDENLVQFENLK